MGEIFKARDEKLDRVVALKAISPALVDEPDARRRFDREARAAAALNHPFICTVHEVVEADSRPYIVMEFVEGGNPGQDSAKDLLIESPSAP